MKTKPVLTLLFIFFLFQVSAQDIVVETYCFSSVGESLKAQQSAKYLMLPADKIENKEICFSLFTTESRRELIQKYLFNSFPQMRIDYSSAENTKDETCELIVEKIKKSNGSDFGLTRFEQKNKDSREISQLKVMSGAPFELSVNEQKLTGNCRYITPTRYEINFSMKFIPKPIIPAVPEGAIVVINNPTPPEPQTGTNLTTIVQVNKGERIELGSIVRDLTDKGHAVSLVPFIDINRMEGQSSEQIFLMLK